MRGWLKVVPHVDAEEAGRCFVRDDPSGAAAHGHRRAQPGQPAVVVVLERYDGRAGAHEDDRVLRGGGRRCSGRLGGLRGGGALGGGQLPLPAADAELGDAAEDEDDEQVDAQHRDQRLAVADVHAHRRGLGQLPLAAEAALALTGPGVDVVYEWAGGPGRHCKSAVPRCDRPRCAIGFPPPGRSVVISRFVNRPT